MVLDSVHHGNKFIKPDKTGIKVPVEESYETRRASSSFDLKPNDTRIETFPHSDHKIVHTIIKKKKILSRSRLLEIEFLPAPRPKLYKSN